MGCPATADGRHAATRPPSTAGRLHAWSNTGSALHRDAAFLAASTGRSPRGRPCRTTADAFECDCGRHAATSLRDAWPAWAKSPVCTFDPPRHRRRIQTFTAGSAVDDLDGRGRKPAAARATVSAQLRIAGLPKPHARTGGTEAFRGRANELPAGCP